MKGFNNFGTESRTPPIRFLQKIYKKIIIEKSENEFLMHFVSPTESDSSEITVKLAFLSTNTPERIGLPVNSSEWLRAMQNLQKKGKIILKKNFFGIWELDL